MFKKILIAAISTLIMISIMATGNYVTIIYKVSQPSGTYPNNLYATAQITYDAYQKPVHTTSPVPAVWDKKNGEASWTLPIGCYVKFICNATGLDGTYQIPNADAYLNDLLPVLPPPEPSWTQNYLKIDGSNANADIDIGEYNFTTAGVGTLGGLILKQDTADGYIMVSDKNGEARWESRYPYGWTADGSIDMYFDLSKNYLSLTNNSYGRELRLQPYGSGFLTFITADSPKTIPIFKSITYNGATKYTIQAFLPSSGEVNLNFPEVGGVVWTDNNDGSDSGLDADTLDGQDASDFLTSEVDGVVGNEITDAYDSSLTRTGAGTSEDPYKLKLNLSNSNTFITNQIAPYWLSSSQFDADNPRPYGYPETSANALDEEFSGSGAPSDWSWLNGGTDISVNQSGGCLTLTPSGSGVKQGFYGKSIADGDYTIAMSAVYPNIGDYCGLFIADSAGNYIEIAVDKANSSYFKVAVYANTAWGGYGSPVGIQNNVDVKYIGLRYWNDGGTRKVSFAFSWDGKNWSTPASSWTGITSGVPSTVAYFGIHTYQTNASNYFKAPMQAINWIRFN